MSSASNRPQNLDHLKKLRIISMQSNRITKLEGLDNLENLEELYLSHNGIPVLEGIEKNVSDPQVFGTLPLLV